MNMNMAPVIPHPLRPSRSSRSLVNLQCVGFGSTCTRMVTWHIVGRGDYCWSCYESCLITHWRDIDVAQIRRLSDNEKDFR